MGGEDSGLLLEIAASSVDAEDVQKRMEGLQTYCHKLERTVSHAGAAPGAQPEVELAGAPCTCSKSCPAGGSPGHP